jgi:WD40 repeat protein/serine/threonine protein kinase
MNHFQFLLSGEPGEEQLVRRALQALEADFRELALLALADWERLGIVAPELFRPVAQLQRPSWGHWNGLLTALREVRKNLVSSGPATQREAIRQAAVLNQVLDLLDCDVEPALNEALRPLAQLVRTPLPRRPKVGTLLTLPITLRNDIAHFQPPGPEWWHQAANGLRPLVEWRARKPLRLDTVTQDKYAAPWFLVQDGEVLACNGLRDACVVYVSAAGEPHESAEMLRSVTQSLKRLFGQAAAEESNLRRLLASLAPEEVKGVLLGDYFLHGPPVGSGGYASVYPGVQVSTGRKVALKVLHGGLGEEARARFQQEAVYLARFQHPNIVGVLGQGVEPWFPPREAAAAAALAREGWFTEFSQSGLRKSFLALEWVEGHTLEQVYQGQRRPGTDEVELARWFAQAADALAAVHAEGLLHRDVKPSNLMVTPSGTIKLMDFGIARTGDELNTITTTPCRALGTPVYMAPEQLTADKPGAEIGPGSDVYALCACFYELFTRTRLFDHGRDGVQNATLRKLQEARPERSRRRAPSLSWEIDVILVGGLEREAADRYRSAADLHRDLTLFLEDRPIRYRRPSLWRRARLYYRRQRTLVNLVAVFPTLAVAGGALYLRSTEERRRKEQDARQEAYFHNIAQAVSAWRANHVERARQLLEECPDDLRAWEWYHLNHLFHPAAATLSHDGRVAAVAFWDDRTVVSVGAAGQSRCRVSSWSFQAAQRATAGQTELFMLPGALSCARFSRGGRRLAVAFQDHQGQGGVAIWDVGARKERTRVPGLGVRALALSPDGSLVALALTGPLKMGETGPLVKVMSLEGGAPTALWELPTGCTEVCDLAFSSDGTRLACGGGKMGQPGLVEVWTLVPDPGALASLVGLLGSPVGQPPLLAAPATMAACARATFRRHQERVRAVTFSPDGKQVASAGDDREVMLWDHATGEHKRTFFGQESGVLSLAIWEDMLAAGGEDQTVTVWDASSGEKLFNCRDHGGGVTCLAFSQDGHWAVTGSADESVKVWDTTREREPKLYGDWPSQPCTALAFSPSQTPGQSSATLASAHSGKDVRIWRLPGYHPLPRYYVSGESCVAYSAKQILATAINGEIRTWDASDLQVDPSRSPRARWKVGQGPIRVVAYSSGPDGKWLASASEQDSTVRVWGQATGRELQRLEGHRRPVTSVAFLPDGHLVSGSLDGTVIVWSIADGRGHPLPPPAAVQPVRHLAVSSGGHWIAAACGEDAGRAGQIVIWGPDRRKRPLSIEQGCPVRCLAFSPESRRPLRLASASEDRTVKLWDVRVGPPRQVLTLDESAWPMTAVVFSPDGKMLATGNNRGIIRVYHAPP